MEIPAVKELIARRILFDHALLMRNIHHEWHGADGLIVTGRAA